MEIYERGDTISVTEDRPLKRLFYLRRLPIRRLTLCEDLDEDVWV